MSEEAKGISRRGFLKIASATTGAPAFLKHLEPLFAQTSSSQPSAQRPGESRHPDRPRVDLDGVWQFQLDPENQGEKLGWHQASASHAPAHFDRSLNVPGAWEAQGLGLPHGPGLEEKTYEGVAWLRRSFAAPTDWKGEKNLAFGWGSAPPGHLLVERPRDRIP